MAHFDSVATGRFQALRLSKEGGHAGAGADHVGHEALVQGDCGLDRPIVVP